MSAIEKENNKIVEMFMEKFLRTHDICTHRRRIFCPSEKQRMERENCVAAIVIVH